MGNLDHFRGGVGVVHKENPKEKHTNWEAITPLAASFTLETHNQWCRRMTFPAHHDGAR
jgi:hypothetical protein